MKCRKIATFWGNSTDHSGDAQQSARMGSAHISKGTAKQYAYQLADVCRPCPRWSAGQRLLGVECNSVKDCMQKENVGQANPDSDARIAQQGHAVWAPLQIQTRTRFSQRHEALFRGETFALGWNGLCLQMSRHVYRCIQMSRQKKFSTTLLGFENGSSPSLNDCEKLSLRKLTDLQRASFTFRYSLG